MDNVFIECLWRSVKHEDIYLKHYADGREAKAGISAWVGFYNTRRFHRALGNRTPMAVWRAAAALAGAGRGYVYNADALPTDPGNSSRRSLWLHNRRQRNGPVSN
jgi:putative transposase